jgi:hypothetical protein
MSISCLGGAEGKARFMRRWVQVLISVGGILAAIAWVASTTDYSRLADTFTELSPAFVAAAAVALVAGALCASLRVWLIARDLGYPLLMRDAVAALSIGQLAGGIFFQIVGQLIARGALLARLGLPVSVTVILTGYERLVAFAVSLALALAGGWLIFGRVVLDVQHGGLEFLELAAGVLLAVLMGGAFGWGRQAVTQLVPHVHGRLALRVSRSVLVSLATQLCTMAAYVLLAHSLSPSLSLEDLAAASAVVMLAASLPISLAGWGVREVSAVMALGAIGMSPEEALIVALLVGVGSLAVVAVLSLLTAGTWRRNKTAAAPEGGQAALKLDYAAGLAWLLPLVAATAVFFQVYVPTGTGQLNVNFADPAALIGGTLFVVWAVRDRRWPLWRLSGLNAHIIGASLAFVLAFTIGWVSFGWTTWAFTSKFLGWFVLLAYGATGALLVSRAGEVGLATLMRTVAATALAIASLDVALTELRFWGYDIPLDLVGQRIEGFSNNANAFGFQLLVAALSALVVFKGPLRNLIITGFLLASIWFAGSRASFGAVAAALALMVFFRPRLGIRALTASVFAVVLCLLIIYAPLFPFIWGGAPPPGLTTIHGALASNFASSDAERTLTLEGAWNMFLDAPLFGAGLGAFVNDQFQMTSRFLVIHSTPLWLLAEFGLVGTVIISAPLVRALWGELRQPAPKDDAGVMLIAIIIAFAIMSLVHEMMYQRLLWLMLGAGLAMTSAPPGVQGSRTR